MPNIYHNSLVLFCLCSFPSSSGFLHKNNQVSGVHLLLLLTAQGSHNALIATSTPFTLQWIVSFVTQNPNDNFFYKMVSFEEQRFFFINILCATKGMINEKRVSFSVSQRVWPVPKNIPMQLTECIATKMKVLVSLKKNFPAELTLRTEPSSHQGWLTKSEKHRGFAAAVGLHLLEHLPRQITGHSRTREQAVCPELSAHLPSCLPGTPGSHPEPR